MCSCMRVVPSWSTSTGPLSVSTCGISLLSRLGRADPTGVRDRALGRFYTRSAEEYCGLQAISRLDPMSEHLSLDIARDVRAPATARRAVERLSFLGETLSDVKLLVS